METDRGPEVHGRRQEPTRRRGCRVKMPADEELNTAKLDDLKTALDDLKIVDVSRKPAGLSADLKKSADFSAQGRGRSCRWRRRASFSPRLRKGQVELFSNEGEIRVDMKDGVEYVLRFGDIAGSGPAKKKDAKKGRKPRGQEKKRRRREPLPVRDGRVQSRNDRQAAARPAPAGQEGRRKEARSVP